MFEPGDIVKVKGRSKELWVVLDHVPERFKSYRGGGYIWVRNTQTELENGWVPDILELVGKEEEVKLSDWL